MVDVTNIQNHFSSCIWLCFSYVILLTPICCHLALCTCIQTIDHIMSGMEDIIGHLGHNRLREKIQEIDSKYLRKIFERYPEARDEQILHTWRRQQYQLGSICVLFWPSIEF